jgi:hypothetical protein
MTADPMTSVRRRLGEISDQLRSLPDDAFSAKNQLSIEADALRRQLTDWFGTDTEATMSRWADRSARKGTHTADDDLERAKAAIVSPIESGGSGNA